MRAAFIHGLVAVIALTELICQGVDGDVSCGNHLKLRMMSTLAQDWGWQCLPVPDLRRGSCHGKCLLYPVVPQPQTSSRRRFSVCLCSRHGSSKHYENSLGSPWFTVSAFVYIHPKWLFPGKQCSASFDNSHLHPFPLQSLMIRTICTYFMFYKKINIKLIHFIHIYYFKALSTAANWELALKRKCNSLIEFCNTSDVNLSYGLNVTAMIALQVTQYQNLMSLKFRLRSCFGLWPYFCVFPKVRWKQMNGGKTPTKSQLGNSRRNKFNIGES